MARGGGPPDASVERGGSPSNRGVPSAGEDLARSLVLDAPLVSDGETELVVVSLDATIEAPLPNAASPMAGGNGLNDAIGGRNGPSNENGHANNGDSNGGHTDKDDGFNRVSREPEHSGSNGVSLPELGEQSGNHSGSNGTANGTTVNDRSLEVQSTPRMIHSVCLSASSAS